MSSHRRVTAALIALLALVVGVWLGRQALADRPGGAHPSVVQLPP